MEIGDHMIWNRLAGCVANSNPGMGSATYSYALRRIASLPVGHCPVKNPIRKNWFVLVPTTKQKFEYPAATVRTNFVLVDMGTSLDPPEILRHKHKRPPNGG